MYCRATPVGKIGPGESDHQFQTVQRVTRIVGVDGAHGSIVTGVHRLEHFHDFAATGFADDDAVGTHTE